MSDYIELSAAIRVVKGKENAKKIRDNKLVPAIVYGDKREPQMITVDFNELLKKLNKGNFKTSVIHLDIDGSVEKVKVQELQLHPVKHIPTHVDFLRISS